MSPTIRVTRQNDISDVAQGVSHLQAIDWGTATGTTDSALSDGGNAGLGAAEGADWNCSSYASAAAVVAGSGVGWTGTENVLRIYRGPEGGGSEACAHIGWADAFPLPEAGAIWAYRYYLMLDATYVQSYASTSPAVGMLNQHGIADFNPVGTIEVVTAAVEGRRGVGNDKYIMGLGFGLDALFPFGARFASAPGTKRLFDADTWYRIEGQIRWHPTDPTLFRIYPRVYDDEGNLLNDYTTLEHTDTGYTLADAYDAAEWCEIQDTAAGMREFAVGASQSWAPEDGYYYIADVALGLSPDVDTWIGA